MMPPTSLQTSTDYYPALLWLMGELGSARATEVMAEFDRRLGDLISPEHRETNSNGSIKWEHYLHWARYYLVGTNLMESGGQGIWAITAGGRDWLQTHSDGNKAELARLIRQSETVRRRHEGQPVRPSPASQPPLPRRDKVVLRDTFFHQVADYLQASLTGEVSHGKVNLFQGKNWMQVHYPEFPGSHYELALRRDTDEIGFHFEAGINENLARLALMQTHVNRLSQILGHQVVAEPWGSRWARLSIDLNSAPWNSDQTEVYADLFLQFITETFPLLRQAFAATRAKRGRSPNISAVRDNQEAHIILDRQINQIREYLRGRVARPSEEVLCEWVYFCYTFELFKESVELFNLINPEAVDTWPYERAKRIAKVCRIRANVS